MWETAVHTSPSYAGFHSELRDYQCSPSSAGEKSLRLVSRKISSSLASAIACVLSISARLPGHVAASTAAGSLREESRASMSARQSPSTSAYRKTAGMDASLARQGPVESPRSINGRGMHHGDAQKKSETIYTHTPTCIMKVCSNSRASLSYAFDASSQCACWSIYSWQKSEIKSSHMGLGRPRPRYGLYGNAGSSIAYPDMLTILRGNYCSSDLLIWIAYSLSFSI